MSFVHGKTGKTYYSIREKIKYYSKRAYNDKTITKEQKQYALKRLDELKALDNRAYSEPTLIITNDKHFGNGIDKPRACVVVGKEKGDKHEKNKRLYVSPIYDRTTNLIILDNDITRQVDKREKLIDRSEVYETKYIEGLSSLTEYDKNKVKAIHNKK